MVLYYHRSIERYYTPVFWFAPRRKHLNHDPTEFTARKQGTVSDQWTTQDRKSLFSVQAASCKFFSWANALHCRSETQRCNNAVIVIRCYDQTTETWRCYNVLCRVGNICAQALMQLNWNHKHEIWQLTVHVGDNQRP